MLPHGYIRAKALLGAVPPENLRQFPDNCPRCAIAEEARTQAEVWTGG